MGELKNRNRHRWGIIYCPRIGVMRAMKRWQEVRRYLAEKGVEYDFLQSEDFTSIERHARMFADNGYETVVVIGGDGALQDALNGIMSSPNSVSVALGIIPYGIANDFAHYWGMSDDYKVAIDSIIAKKIRKIDVGHCRYNDGAGMRDRYFINVLNVGLSAHIVGLANKKNTRFARVGYRVKGLFYLLFRRQNFRVRMRLNCQVVDRKMMMLCVGNSRGYGMTPSAVPYNGFLDVSAIKMPPFMGAVKGLSMVIRRKILNFELVEPFRTSEVVIESVDGAPIGIDGRPFYPSFPLTVTVEPESLNLIIPTKLYKKL